ncbi:hypothetical protein TIFTF001_029259 [Ficus carica]|uniref:Uncharacterized protein n=1 Tax=Ficus carica TaxID=3494 RepID=A0AA88J351_FICCA|nr:hypothetical protein TIFTF001_029259 [Ficus carica]
MNGIHVDNPGLVLVFFHPFGTLGYGELHHLMVHRCDGFQSSQGRSPDHNLALRSSLTTRKFDLMVALEG